MLYVPKSTGNQKDTFTAIVCNLSTAADSPLLSCEKAPSDCILWNNYFCSKTLLCCFSCSAISSLSLLLVIRVTKVTKDIPSHMEHKIRVQNPYNKSRYKILQSTALLHQCDKSRYAVSKSASVLARCATVAAAANANSSTNSGSSKKFITNAVMNTNDTKDSPVSTQLCNSTTLPAPAKTANQEAGAMGNQSQF